MTRGIFTFQVMHRPRGVPENFQNGGESRRFSCSSRSGHQHDVIAQSCDFFQLRRQSQGSELRNGGWNHSHNYGATAALNENVDAKTCQPWQAEGNIAGSLLAECGYGLFVAADQIRGDTPSVISGEQVQSRALYWN